MDETSECLLCEKVMESAESLKFHLTETHLIEVAMTALQPTAEPTSIWIQNALWNDKIYQQDTASEIQDDVEEVLEVSPLSEQTEKSSTLSPCESITSQASPLSDKPICTRKLSFSSSNSDKSDVSDDALLSAESSAKPSDHIESPHSAESIVDSFNSSGKASDNITSSSKEKNIAVSLFCQECKEIVDETDKERHLYEVHSKQNLFKCPFCDFAASVEDSVDDHLNQFHASFNMIGAISQIDQFAADIASWEERCFRSTNRRLPQNVQSRTSDKDCCRICGKVPKAHKKAHIYCHLNVRKMFSCPLCDYAHSNRIDEVRRHMKKRHKDTNASVISRETEFSSQFSEMKEKCFPGPNIRSKRKEALKQPPNAVCVAKHKQSSLRNLKDSSPPALSSRDVSFSKLQARLKEECFPGH